MYTKYVKDPASGRILGVVVAVATNMVGFAIAKSEGNIDKDVKHELILMASARCVTQNTSQNAQELSNYLRKNECRNNTTFYDKVDQIYYAFEDMCWKASHSHTLPTLVYPTREEDS